MEQALDGINALKEHVDSLVIIPNDRIREVSDTKITMKNAFEMADDVLRIRIGLVGDHRGLDALVLQLIEEVLETVSGGEGPLLAATR